MNELLKDVRNRDLSSVVKAVQLVTYWAAVLFAEIMFIQIMASVFPDGIVRYFAIFGAVMNGATACIMPFSKDHYFAPGKMHWAGLLLWALDVAVLFLNVLLAFEVQQGIRTGGLFSWWYDFSPASPLMAIVTWGVLMVLSPEHEIHQKEMLRKTRLADQYSEAELDLIEAGEVDDIFKSGARTNVRDYAEKLAGRKIRVPRQPKQEKQTEPAPSSNGHKKENIRFNSEVEAPDPTNRQEL